MAKTKTPFFGLGAQGSVGESITAQKRNSSTLLRAKPLPADPYSLPQAYQRWLYQDYAYLWTLQSQATRQSYATGGAKLHLTGQQYWMKVMLSTLPDIVGWWRLDERTGVISKDSSKNANDGTIIGPSFTPGFIDHALDFDGVDNYIRIPTAPSLDLISAITLEAVVYLKSTTGWRTIAAKVNNIYRIVFTTGTLIPQAYIQLLGLAKALPSTLPATLNDWTHVAMTYDKDAASPNYKIYVNGELGNSATFTDPIDTLALPFHIGAIWAAGQPFHGTIDNVILYNRALDQTELRRHTARRYPP